MERTKQQNLWRGGAFYHRVEAHFPFVFIWMKDCFEWFWHNLCFRFRRFMQLWIDFYFPCTLPMCQGSCSFIVYIYIFFIFSINFLFTDKKKPRKILKTLQLWFIIPNELMIWWERNFFILNAFKDSWRVGASFKFEGSCISNLKNLRPNIFSTR